MADDKMRAALEAAKEELLPLEGMDGIFTPDGLKHIRTTIQAIDDALASKPTPAVTDLKDMPALIATCANEVLRLQVEMCKQERELDLLHAENAYEVFTNPEYKSDAVRKAKLVMALQTHEAYHEKQKTRDRTKYALELARIAHQRSRDTFDAYRSIAAMETKT